MASVPERANRVLNVILFAMVLILLRVWHVSVVQHDARVEEGRRPQRRREEPFGSASSGVIVSDALDWSGGSAVAAARHRELFRSRGPDHEHGHGWPPDHELFGLYRGPDHVSSGGRVNHEQG